MTVARIVSVFLLFAAAAAFSGKSALLKLDVGSTRRLHARHTSVDNDLFNTPCGAIADPWGEACKTRTTPMTPKAESSMLILKVGGSGSSWLVWLMQQLDSVYMLREGIAAAMNTCGFTQEQYENYLTWVLQEPTGIIRLPDSIPESEFTMKTLQCVRDDNCKVKLTGLTMNPYGIPESFRDQALQHAVNRVNQTKVVIYRRTNLVKHALAQRGGPHVSQQFVQQGNLPSEYGVKEILGLIDTELKHETELRRLMGNVLSTQDTMELYYEDLQLDPLGAINKLMNFAGEPDVAADFKSADKFSDEDLHNIISPETYSKLEAELEARSPCLVKMLRSKVPEVFQPCGLASYF